MLILDLGEKTSAVQWNKKCSFCRKTATKMQDNITHKMLFTLNENLTHKTVNM